MLENSAGMPSFRLETIGASLDWVVAQLKSRGVIVAPSSPFDVLAKRIRLLMAAANGLAQLPVGLKFTEMIRMAMGLDYLIKAIHRCEGRSAWPRIAERLDDFGRSDVTFFHAAKRTPERDRVWELLLACWVCHFCEDIAFDEPDVTFSFDGEPWGVAAKVIYSKTPNSMIKSIIKGVKQLEGSSAALGLVVANCSNLLTHGQYLPLMPGKEDEYGAYFDERAPINMLACEMGAVIGSVDKPSFLHRLTVDTATGADRLKTRGVLFVGQTVSACATPKGPIPMVLTHVNLFDFRHIHGPEHTFFKRLNEAAQTTPHEGI